MRRALIAGWLCACLCGCDGCEGPRGGEEVPVSGVGAGAYQEVSGEGWAASVPAGWERREEGVYVGPDRANVVISAREVEEPLEALLEGARSDLERANEGYERLGQRALVLGGQPALELRGRYQRNGRSVTHHTVMVEGGRRKYVLTLSAVTPAYAANEAAFGRITASFRGEVVR